MNRSILAMKCAVCLAAPLVCLAQAGFHPMTRSQLVECNQVDKVVARIPQGDGNGSLEDGETGPGGWFFLPNGQSFQTTLSTLNASKDGYGSVFGRSNENINSGILNDYPVALDQTSSSVNEVFVFDDVGGAIPVRGVTIELRDPDGDGKYEGCAETPLHKGRVKKQLAIGGIVLKKLFFKAWAQVGPDGTVNAYEITQIETRRLSGQ